MTADHYPVRRRDEARRLNPNRAAIEWLESDENHFEHYTEITACLETGDGLAALTARGTTLYARPMFQVLPIPTTTENSWPGMRAYCGACPDCDDWAYTTRCEKHPDTTPPQRVLINVLPSFSTTRFEPPAPATITLEITGETTQEAGPLLLEVEPRDA